MRMIGMWTAVTVLRASQWSLSMMEDAAMPAYGLIYETLLYWNPQTVRYYW